MESKDRTKKRIRVTRQLDENGNPIPHRHQHSSKLYKHADGELAYASEVPESTNAISYYPNTTGDVTSISLTTQTSTKESKHSKSTRRLVKSKNNASSTKSKRRKLHYDPESPEFRGKPIHVLDNLSDLYYDSADGDDFAQLERDQKFNPQRSLKPDPRYRGKHYMDTTTMSESTIDTVPSTAPPTATERDLKSNGFDTYASTTTEQNTTESFETASDDGENKSRRQRDPSRSSRSDRSYKSYSKKSFNPSDYGQLRPSGMEYSLFDEYAAGKAITKLEDIILTQDAESTVDSEYIPARPEVPREIELDPAREASGVYIEASDPSYDYIGVEEGEEIPENAVEVAPAEKSYYGANIETDGLVTVEEFVSATSGSAEFVEDPNNPNGQVLIEVTQTSSVDDSTIDVIAKPEFQKKYEYAKSVYSSISKKDNSSIAKSVKSTSKSEYTPSSKKESTAEELSISIKNKQESIEKSEESMSTLENKKEEQKQKKEVVDEFEEDEAEAEADAEAEEEEYYEEEDLEEEEYYSDKN